MNSDSRTAAIQTNPLPWWVITLIAFTLPLVLYNYPNIYAQLPDAWIYRRGSFRMIFEMNYPTWWTAILLFAAAMLLYELVYIRRKSSRLALCMLALLFAGLSFDEIASMHERVSLLSDKWLGSPWTALTPFALCGLIALVYGIKAMSRSDEGGRAITFLIAGIMMFVFVVVQEYLEHHPEFPKFVYKTLGITDAWARWFEEVTEMVGAMLILIGAALARNRGVFNGDLGFILTKPLQISSLRVILLIGLIIHCVIAFYFLPDAKELTFRGNPAGWYPSAVFFVLFAHAYWQFRYSYQSYREAFGAANTDKRLIASGWLMLAVFCILCSIGFLHNFGHVIADAIPGIRKPFYFNPLIIYSCVLVAVIGFAFWLIVLSRQWIIYVFLLICVPLLEYSLDDRGTPFAASGITSYLIACLFLTLPQRSSATAI